MTSQANSKLDDRFASRNERAASIAGLLAVWGGSALLVSPAALVLGEPGLIATDLLGQLVFWVLFIVVVWIVVFWEREPVASLWLQPFRLRSVAWAGLLIAVHIFVIYPVTEMVRQTAGLSGYGAGMERVTTMPIWLSTLAVMTAGIVEETLFRGYALTRLVTLTGSLSLAAILSALAFAALHLPLWGLGPAIGFFSGGIALNAFFIWRRDLIAMIIAHVAIDGWALIIAPHFYKWWM